MCGGRPGPVDTGAGEMTTPDAGFNVGTRHWANAVLRRPSAFSTTRVTCWAPDTSGGATHVRVAPSPAGIPPTVQEYTRSPGGVSGSLVPAELRVKVRSTPTTGTHWATAVGERPKMRTDAAITLDAPVLSVTRSVTVWEVSVLPFGNRSTNVGPVSEPDTRTESPGRVHCSVSASPSGSDDVDVSRNSVDR